jgi:uncharacterized protein YggE
VDQDGGLASDARGDAVRQAASQASAMAAAARVHLGRLCSVSDAAIVTQPSYSQQFAASTSAAGAVPLAPGTQNETATVTVVYATAP